MKKIAVLALALAFLVPISAPAQTVSETQVEELRQTLITLLTEMIAQLQAQINELIAKQAVLEEKVTESQVTEPVEEAVLGVQRTVTFGPVCASGQPYTDRQKINARTTITGGWQNLTVSYMRYPVVASYLENGTSILTSEPKQKQTISVNNVANKDWTNIWVYNFPDTYEVEIVVDDSLIGTQTLEVPLCE